jgi:hypothetical protein
MSPEFTRRIGVVPILRSMFQDRFGWWAKRWRKVTLVTVTFSDNVTTVLTVAEFKSLPKSQQELIFQSPSAQPGVTALSEDT